MITKTTKIEMLENSADDVIEKRARARKFKYVLLFDY